MTGDSPSSTSPKRYTKSPGLLLFPIRGRVRPTVNLILLLCTSPTRFLRKMTFKPIHTKFSHHGETTTAITTTNVDCTTINGDCRHYCRAISHCYGDTALLTRRHLATARRPPYWRLIFLVVISTLLFPSSSQVKQWQAPAGYLSCWSGRYPSLRPCPPPSPMAASSGYEPKATAEESSSQASQAKYHRS